VAEAASRLGIDSLHAEQEQVLSELLEGRDVLMVLPTGFGKSACYQIPSMLLPKPVLVISPLQALLKDQHQKLLKRGVPCVRLDGTVRGKERRETLARIEEGGSLLVMTTPETLASAEAEEVLRKCGVSMVAIDEAHCVSEWGHDFRPTYLRLGVRIRSLGAPPILGLTATATPKVRESIVKQLGMRDPVIVSSSPHRSNLAFDVIPVDEDERPRALVRLLKKLRRPGIVYCATTKEVDAVWGLLQHFGMPCHRYHGKMQAKVKNEEQEKYMKSGRRTVMVATNAFGLGIDKPDIRYVLHYQSPAALEQYVQEAGRAGRDGHRAHCILLANEADRKIHELLLARSRIRPDQLYRLGRALAAYAEEGREATLEALALSAEQGPRVALSLLSKLEEVGLVEIDGDTVRILADRKTLAEGARVLSSQFETLRIQDGRRLDAVQEYAQEQECRAVYLRRYFGEEEGEACGLCDVCQDRTRGGSLFRPLAPPPRKKGRPRRGRGGRARGGGRRETGRGASESDRGGRTGKKRRRSRRRRPRHA